LSKPFHSHSPLFTPHVSSLTKSPNASQFRYYATQSSATKSKGLDDSYEYTNVLQFHTVETPISCFQIMDQSGVVNPSSSDPSFGKDEVIKMYRMMVQLNLMDSIMYDVQRQGRISFYMTSFGEEATHIGSAAALSPEDTIFGQYREAGVLLYRGFTLEEMMNQCTSNQYDYGKGRQMPIHYGSSRLNFQTISSPLGTQIPQAVGASYAQKLLGVKACTIVYFGEGAASEGDFHAAMNFAATLSTPTIFFCRNNKWAISTPSFEQYRGDGIVGRGLAYGMDSVRVDGNDIWAVYLATKEARKKAVENHKPVIIEAMTYRVGHHSTSDDSTRYRTIEEVNFWKEHNNPIVRLRNYMVKKSWWSEEMDQPLVQECRTAVREALAKAEKALKPDIAHLFTDVYDTMPKHLLEQKAELEKHLRLYPEEYPLESHAKSRSG